MSTGEKGASEILGDLQAKGDHFTKLSVVEKKRMLDLNDALSYVTSETEKYRSSAKKTAIQVMNLHVLTPNPAYSRADGVDVGRQARQVTMKALNILEWKLNTKLQRKSEAIIENKKLKGEIDHYRRLRLQTDISHSKYEEKLKITREKIEHYLSESSAVVEERDRLLERRDALERINVDEQKVFAVEYEDLGAFIKQQNEALEDALLRERKADRSEKNSKAATAAMLSDPSIESLKCNLTLDEEVEMASQVGSLSKSLVGEATTLSSVQSKIANYEIMFDQLKKMSSASSMEQVISSYTNQEEEMFSLYNFIQNVNTDISATVEQSHQIDVDIENLTYEQKLQEESKLKVLDDLQARQAHAQEANRSGEEVNRLLSDNVSLISKKVQNIFIKLQCDQIDSKPQATGAANSTGAKGPGKASMASRPESKVAVLATQSVTDTNVLDFMGCIELRAVDVITQYLAMMTEATKGKKGALLSPTPGPPTPMHWAADTKQTVELDLVTDDFIYMDEKLHTPGKGVGGDDDYDSKPVDLASFKERLSKKFGLDAKRVQKK